MQRWLLSVLSVCVLSAPAVAATPPWARTETRAACANSQPLRQAFFGDVHIHTRFSADAYIFGTRVGPRDAYDFATGGTIAVSDDDEQQTRSASIDRPLDFAAVTDHAELFGEVDRCITPGSPAYEVNLCQLLRKVEQTADEEFLTTVSWLFPLGIPNPPTGLSMCTDTPGVDCDAAAISVWQEMQAAAEQFYDRTDACRFTTFIGYEHTPSPLGRHRHRNVIFRNQHVPPIALSHLDTLPGGVPQGLWNALDAQCLQAGTGCDAVIIPHNSNRSGGEQFVDPTDAADALRRQTFEPLVEIHQIKGNSECRFDRLAGLGVGSTDDLCTFEQMIGAHEGPDATDVGVNDFPRRNLIRPTLEDGLGFEQTLGANPFRFGFIGGTDTHDATAGAVDERTWIGGQGRNDGSAASLIGGNLRTNPGGLAVVWAEENSRDAIFAAMKRRETYATSGTRPQLRFFAGDLSDVTCGAADFLARAYATGVAMGGELGPLRGRKSPRFAVWAMKDPGTATAPGTDLQRLQIVKGWVDASGATHEEVVDVAGDANNGATVDPATCAPQGLGAAELCTVWEDPHFDPLQRAFYYVRALENPSCRWSTRVCQQAGVDPFAADCAAQAAAAPAAFGDCCLNTSTDRFLSPTIQERAWSSPIWYRPDAVARLRGRVGFGRRTGRDHVALRFQLAERPPTWDLKRDAFTLSITDDDTIFSLAVPAGGLRRHGKRWSYKQRTGGRVTLTITDRPRGAIVALAANGIDLSNAAREDHPVSVTIATGVFRAEHNRWWRSRGAGLAPETK